MEPVHSNYGEAMASKPRPNDRVADTCGNCAERGRVIVFCAECLLHGGCGGKLRVCNNHMKRINVTKCPECGARAHFVELKNEHREMTGIGYYDCFNQDCSWTSGEKLIPPKGIQEAES